ncbi:hypothetical protein H0E87_014980, partial [Populus deltoides]
QLRDFLMAVGFSGCYGMCLAAAGCVWLLLYATLFVGVDGFWGFAAGECFPSMLGLLPDPRLVDM